MNYDLSNATVVLSIDTVEVYQTIDQTTSLILQGNLDVLYLASHNYFIIKVDTFTYYLSKEVFVLAFPGKRESDYPSYAFPHIDGQYIIRVVKIASLETLSSLETILDNHCNLSYEDEDIKTDFPVTEPETAETVKEKEHIRRTKTEIASKIIYNGGELTRKGIVKSAKLISKGISKFGDFLQKRSTKHQEKEVSEETLNKLRIANIATKAALTFTKNQAQGVIMVAKGVGKEMKSSFNETDTSEKKEKHKYRRTVTAVGKCTLHAAASVFNGVTEAASIIGRGIGETTTKVVAHKYGEKMGDATEQGFDVLANIGRLVKTYPTEVAKAVEKATTMKA